MLDFSTIFKHISCMGLFKITKLLNYSQYWNVRIFDRIEILLFLLSTVTKNTDKVEIHYLDNIDMKFKPSTRKFMRYANNAK